MRRSTWILTLIMAFGGGAWASGEIVARVNGRPVTVEQLREEARTPPGTPAGQPLDHAAREEVLERLIAQELLAQEAERLGYAQHPKVRALMVDLLLREQVYATLPDAAVTEEAMSAHFAAHREDYIVPAKVQIQTLTVLDSTEGAVAAREKATALYTQLRANPELFRDLAQQHSQDPWGRRGGDLGFVPAEGKPGVDPAVVALAFGAPVGEVQPPLRTETGWVIVLPAARRETVERTYEQMRGTVLRDLKSQAAEQARQDYVQRLVEQADIDIDRRVLRDAQLKAPSLPSPSAAPEDPG